MTAQLSPHFWLAEPSLAFHPDRVGDRDVHPLRGLVRHGPYSEGLVLGPIRVATIHPNNEGQALFSFLKELRTVHEPAERRDYLPVWPGFRAVFNLDLAAAPASHLALPSDADERLYRSDRPHRELAEMLTRALSDLEANRSEFDVVFVYLPERWRTGFVGGEDDDFDLHDHLKAFTALRGIPIQLVREGSALSYPCRASVMWRIGLALYTKAGGVPWKLSDANPETAYIGLSYALRTMQAGSDRFVTCCSQVFDEQGGGLEFIAYDAHEVQVQRSNPFLSRTEMFRLVTRSMDLYRRRHAGRLPRHVVVHKTTEFKNDEVRGTFDALASCESVDLVQIVEHTGWRGIRIDGGPESKKGKPTAFPVQRGSVLPLGDYEALLWTHGDAAGVGNKGSYYQGGKSIPEPLRLIRHAGHGPWDDTARAVLALTKMNWNNDALHDRLPVTLEYAKVLARTIKRMDTLGTKPYQCRFFM